MIDALNEIIRIRRSVFPDQFEEGKQVPDDIINQILQNATWAPTHKLTEPWQFVVFTGDGLKKLSAFQSELYKKTETNFKEDKYVKMQKNPLKASHVIAVGMKRNATRVPEVEEIIAVGCAIQNMYLSVTAYGLGGYFSTGGATYIDEAKEFFGLKEEDKLLGFFYIGHIKNPSPAGKRKPMDEKVTWVN